MNDIVITDNAPDTVLMFVEDPGAANCIAPIPSLLTGLGRRVRLLAAGTAVKYLKERDIAAEEIRSGASASSLLDRSRPMVFVTGTALNPETMGLRLIKECRSRDIVTAAIVDTRANAAHRFQGVGNSPLAFAPDWLMVPDDATRIAFEHLGYPPERIKICGHPHYDEVRAAGILLAGQDRMELRRRLFPGLEEPRSVMIFLTEPFGGPDTLEDRRTSGYTLSGRGGSDHRNHIVIEEFLDSVKQMVPKPFTVLRLHPKNTEHEFLNYLKEFDLVSMGGSPTDLVYAADLTVGMTSMLLLEAAILGRQALAVLPRALEQEWLPAPADNAIPFVTTRDELRAALPRMLREKRAAGITGLAENSKQHVLDVILMLSEQAETSEREKKEVQRHG
jgi:hypothetical protein